MSVVFFSSHVHSFYLCPFIITASGSCLRYHIHLVLLSLSHLWLFPVFLITVTVLKRALLDCYYYSKMPEINNEEQKGLHCITMQSSHSRMEWSHHFRFLTRVGHCRRAGHPPPESGSEEKMRAIVVQKLLLRHSPKVPKASHEVLPPKRSTICQQGSQGVGGGQSLIQTLWGTLIQTQQGLLEYL